MTSTRNLVRSFLLLATAVLAAAACSDRTGMTDPITDAPAFAKGGPNAPPTNEGRIFFVSQIAGNPEIYSVNHDGTDLRRLTYTPEQEAHPAVSPDGRKVAFLRYSGPTFDIWIMDSDGRRPKLRLTAPDYASNVSNVTWSPDGKSLTFSFQDQNTLKLRIATMNVNSGAPVVLPLEGWLPSWSPDGQYLAYQVLVPGEGNAVATSRPDGSDFVVRTAAYTSGCCGQPRWSPDGQRILYTVSDNGVGVLHAARATGIAYGPLTSAEAPFGAAPAWSPDGFRIVYAAGGNLRVLYGTSDNVILPGVHPTGRLDWSR